MKIYTVEGLETGNMELGYMEYEVEIWYSGRSGNGRAA